PVQLQQHRRGPDQERVRGPGPARPDLPRRGSGRGRLRRPDVREAAHGGAVNGNGAAPPPDQMPVDMQQILAYLTDLHAQQLGAPNLEAAKWRARAVAAPHALTHATTPHD